MVCTPLDLHAGDGLRNNLPGIVYNRQYGIMYYAACYYCNLLSLMWCWVVYWFIPKKFICLTVYPFPCYTAKHMYKGISALVAVLCAKNRHILKLKADKELLLKKCESVCCLEILTYILVQFQSVKTDDILVWFQSIKLYFNLIL